LEEEVDAANEDVASDDDGCVDDKNDDVEKMCALSVFFP
jgi:hypothetical protein